MGNRSSRIYKGQQLSEKMADGSKEASGLGMADGSKKVSAHEVKPGVLIEISRKNNHMKTGPCAWQK
uniref:Uncharacterized protein n=1 Tax=Anguilla anguilla TaxID=7936 RepID=A0A0E9R8R7_ANGAN